jgi:hypothetical protein
MAFGRFERIVIFDETLYRPGGLVWLYVGRITRKFATEARRAAPVRSGELRAGIRAGTPRKPSLKKVSGTIGSTAPHTMAVLRGTHGPIMSDALWATGGTLTGIPGQKLAVGRDRLYPPVTPMSRVAGQRANNFFAVAWVKTAARHPSIRGTGVPRVLR